jgi:hypothetical protein
VGVGAGRAAGSEVGLARRAALGAVAVCTVVDPALVVPGALLTAVDQARAGLLAPVGG